MTHVMCYRDGKCHGAAALPDGESCDEISSSDEGGVIRGPHVCAYPINNKAEFYLYYTYNRYSYVLYLHY